MHLVDWATATAWPLLSALPRLHRIRPGDDPLGEPVGNAARYHLLDPLSFHRAGCGGAARHPTCPHCRHRPGCCRRPSRINPAQYAAPGATHHHRPGGRYPSLLGLGGGPRRTLRRPRAGFPGRAWRSFSQRPQIRSAAPAAPRPGLHPPTQPRPRPFLGGRGPPRAAATCRSRHGDGDGTGGGGVSRLDAASRSARHLPGGTRLLVRGRPMVGCPRPGTPQRRSRQQPPGAHPGSPRPRGAGREFCQPTVGPHPR